MSKPGLFFNQDCDNFFCAHTPEQMTLECCQAFVDQYADSAISHLFINCSSQRASYPSDVWTWYGDVDEAALAHTERGGPESAWLRSFKTLRDNGLDNFSIWINRAREIGISPWLSMRMNDLHTVHEHHNPLNNPFWRDHPEYWRVPDSLEDEGFEPVRCFERAYDYGHQAVRDHHMTLIREMLQRYEPDGIELDWMRFPAHFRVGHEAEGRELFNAFMREVRELTEKLARKCGHAVQVAARVPSHPVRARELGMDGLTWAREGFVDVLIPTPFWFSADFDIPMELWCEMLGPARERITLVGGVEVTLRMQRSIGTSCSYNDPASARGQMVGMLDRGADAAYLFNYMGYQRDEKFIGPTPAWSREDYAELVNIGCDGAKLLELPRRHIVTFDDTVPPGTPLGCLLPKKFNGTEPAAFRLYTGPVPSAGRAAIRIGLGEHPGVENVTLKARFNSHYCTPEKDLPLCDPLERNPQAAPFDGAARAIQFAVPLKQMNHGYNIVELIQPYGVDGQEVVWVEILIEPDGAAIS